MSKNTITMNPGWNETYGCGAELKSQIEGAVAILNEGLEGARAFTRVIDVVIIDIPYKQHLLPDIAHAIAKHSNYIDELLKIDCKEFVLRSSHIPELIIDGKRTDVDPNTGKNYNIGFSEGYCFESRYEEEDQVDYIGAPSIVVDSD